MASKSSEFQPIVNNMDDEEEDMENNDNEEEEEEEEKKEENIGLNYDAIQSRAESILMASEIASPMESKHQHKTKKQEPHEMHSKLLYELLDKDQRVPEKVEYDYDIKEQWEYHPTLGDLEKREITIITKNVSKNKKGNKKSNPSKTSKRKEILWFAKDDFDSKRKVFISLKIKRISAIDNVKETFRMRFHVYLNWIMTEREYRQYIADKEGEYIYEPTWKPDLEFMNAVEIHKFENRKYPEFGKYKVEILKDFAVDRAFEKVNEDEFDPLKTKFIRTKLECDITFAEELELQAFPFDCQDLSVIIKGNFLNKQKYIFLPELRGKNFGSIDSRYSVLDEWDLTTALLEFADDQSGRMEHIQYPTIVLRLKMKRKWKIYVINIVLLLCALCGLSLCAFYLNHEQLGERLGLLITLILTSVAFSIVIQDKLPNVQYLTFIDKYILVSYLFLILVMVESVGVSTIDDEESRENWDHTLFYIASVLWIILMGVVFIIYAYRLRQHEEKKVLYSSDEVNDIVNRTLPTLVFDYKNSKRTGHKQRILSFMAEIKIDDNTSEKDRTKFENLRRKHHEFVELQRSLSMHHGEQTVVTHSGK